MALDVALAARGPAPSAVPAAFYSGASYPPALDTAMRPRADGQKPDSVPASGSGPGAKAPHSPAGQAPHAPFHNEKNLPTPTALPAAPGSGSGNTISSGGPSSGAAWLPSLYLIIPTAAAEPIRGPLQHAHPAAAADPGSSPD
ncbi:hypothetical protein BJQ89_01970 [Arthrobacter sp. ES1]|nr:hypothetical protein [Arthrobacter sp. ES1]